METSEQTVDELRQQTVNSMRIAWEQGDQAEANRIEIQHVHRVNHCCDAYSTKEIESCPRCGCLYIYCQQHPRAECIVCKQLDATEETQPRS